MMSPAYFELLDATIQLLEDMKMRGDRWIIASPELINDISASGSRRASRSIAIPETSLPAKESEARATATPQTVELPAVQGVNTIGEAKRTAMSTLRATAEQCQECPHLAKSRKSVVFGVGDINATLMFVGEAPGADEDIQGEPFVGAAGQLLTKIIKTMGFSRESVYIANVLKCRPDTPGQSYGNRKPTPVEMKTCLPYLLEQIRLIQPKVIVALGATAMEGLFGRPIPISKVRGHWQDLNGTPVMPTFHPSFLLRNQTASVKRDVWEDMLRVLEKLEIPISEKQRNYFQV